MTSFKNYKFSKTNEFTDVRRLIFSEPLLLLGLIRPIKPSRAAAAAPGDVTAQEGTDWLGMLWTLAVSLVAPDDEEEGIHQLTETLTCKKTSHSFVLTAW